SSLVDSRLTRPTPKAVVPVGNTVLAPPAPSTLLFRTPSLSLILESGMANRKSPSATSARHANARAHRKAKAHAQPATLRQQEIDRVNALPITHRHAAGIDIGGSSHWVCVGFTPTDDPRLVRELPAHTAGLRQIVAFLREHQVSTVAMESTGIYWVPLYE